ncbi:uncharacterized protein LOC117103324, partial [Anneissia japonica]|uniref:uncharacterized protein LOC117103324 n=1 Tax=Anneissia japonica TaxID=1529436 RepID=UPI0014259C82
MIGPTNDYVNPQPYKPASLTRQWTPTVSKNPFIESFVNTAKSHLNAFINKNTGETTKDNLTKTERIAIKELNKNQNITIKKADKGGATTIMNTSDYVAEAETQLTNNEFYKLLDADPTVRYCNELTSLCTELSANTSDLIKDLIPLNPRPGTFYTIPKLHKLPKLLSDKLNSLSHNASVSIPSEQIKLFNLVRTHKITPPGRPIVSAIGTLTEHLSGYIDSLLQPLIPSIPSFVKDTTHFLNILGNTPILPNNSLLVTLDVSSLNSIIPHDEGLQALATFLPQHSFSHEHTNDIISITNFILAHNNFTFNNKHYLQIKGTAMGTKMAPNYANIFMSILESKLIASFPLKPLFYRRYIDDIFIIWPHGEYNLKTFMDH